MSCFFLSAYCFGERILGPWHCFCSGCCWCAARASQGEGWKTGLHFTDRPKLALDKWFLGGGGGLRWKGVLGGGGGGGFQDPKFCVPKSNVPFRKFHFTPPPLQRFTTIMIHQTQFLGQCKCVCARGGDGGGGACHSKAFHSGAEGCMGLPDSRWSPPASSSSSNTYSSPEIVSAILWRTLAFGRKLSSTFVKAIFLRLFNRPQEEGGF